MGKRLFSTLLVAQMALNAPFAAHAATTTAAPSEVTVNQVLQTVFASRKAAIVASANARLQRWDFYRGTFFKGKVPEIERLAAELQKFPGPEQFSVRAVESPRGVAIIAGDGQNTPSLRGLRQGGGVLCLRPQSLGRPCPITSGLHPPVGAEIWYLERFCGIPGSGGGGARRTLGLRPPGRHGTWRCGGRYWA